MTNKNYMSTQNQDNFLIRYATSIAIGTVTILMILAAILLWWQSQSNIKAKEWVAHTYNVRDHIRLLLSTLKDAELGHRGYILTGREEHLEVYEKALKDATGPYVNDPAFVLPRSVMQEFMLVRKMTSDNPIQQNNLSEMEEDLKAFLDYLAATIDRRKNEEDKAIIDVGKGKILMDKVRTMARILESEENHLLKLRTEVEDSNAKRNFYLVIIFSFIFYVGINLAIWLYQRSRAHAAAQMLLYTRELEKREEELKQQQEELKASNEEIEASNEELKEKTNALEEQNQRISQQSQELEQTKRVIEEKITEIERASKYKSEFLANMSHELRTPLNSLLILAKGLAANEEGNLTSEQVEEARVIHNGGLELLGLINDILDLSKVEAGKISVIPEEIHFEGIVKRMQEQFSPVSKEKNIEFIAKLDKGLPQFIHTDGQRVEQILKNLLSNAFKFTERGSITLNIHSTYDKSELQRASFQGQQAVAFSVVDTGIGIDETKLRDIFEAFQQEDGSIDRHYGGTGLGLTIARKFAHLLGGEVHVSSKKGSGSTFTLYLPLNSKETQPANSSEPQSKSIHPIRVEVKKDSQPLARVFIADDRKAIGDTDKLLLIVEDDRDFAATLMKISKKRGYKCLVAGDGKSGLLLASEYPVTAILLDLRLPDIDGLTVLDQLKHNLKTRHIPVHIITGVVDSDAGIPLKKGAIGCLIKPVKSDDLDGVFSRIEGLLKSEVKNILVAEDDKKTQAAIQSLLRQKNVEIIFAENGNVALQSLKSVNFDCIILDLRLPDMTGFEWLKLAEKAIGTNDLPPTIIYTAQELTEEENRQLNLYTDSIVIKGASSSERLLDEVTLFLHSVESTLSKTQQAMIRMQHDPDRALYNRTIMLVDDDMRNVFALSKLLKKHGMKVVIADNGQMAIEKLSQDKSIELVIMDIMMPIMDGYQAMREIRSRSYWKSLPMIALTARAMPEEQERCMEAGANDYLVKPVDIERLLTLLRVWLFKQEKAA